jgi:enoyl-CoA hydratase/carnithine racemase
MLQLRRLHVDGAVAVVTLNAPDRRNALTPGMADELIATTSPSKAGTSAWGSVSSLWPSATSQP